MKAMKQDEGFTTATATCEDFVAAGVIGPATVVRSARQNAALVSSLRLTTAARISRMSDAEART